MGGVPNTCMYIYIIHINMYNYKYIYCIYSIYKYVCICVRMYMNKTQLPTEFPHFIASLDARIGGEVLQETKKHVFL